MTAERTTPGPDRAKRRRRMLRIGVLTLALLVIVALTLRGRMPGIGGVLAALKRADYAWIALGAGWQAVSMVAFAVKQQMLLKAMGVRVRVGRLTLITLARSAISISLPAGAAVSAGYAVQQYRRAGSSNEVAAATMIVSGLVAIVGLAALYVVGVFSLVVHDPTSLWDSPPPALIVTAVVVLGVIAGCVLGAVVSWRRRRYGPPPTGTIRPEPSGRLARYAWAAWVAARNAWREGSSLKVRHWIGSSGYAAANWGTDLLCLAACTRALGMPIGITTLASIYLGVQIVRQVPITPGGVGLIETAFIAGLTAAGADAATATAAVLLYRVLSCWLIIPIGGLCAVALRRAPDLSEPTADAAPPRSRMEAAA